MSFIQSARDTQLSEKRDDPITSNKETPEKTQTQTNASGTLRNFEASYYGSEMTWSEIRDVFSKAKNFK